MYTVSGPSTCKNCYLIFREKVAIAKSFNVKYDLWRQKTDSDDSQNVHELKIFQKGIKLCCGFWQNMYFSSNLGVKIQNLNWICSISITKFQYDKWLLFYWVFHHETHCVVNCYLFGWSVKKPTFRSFSYKLQ